MKVAIMVGAAAAYACIRPDAGAVRSIDIRLEPGRSAPQSLREYAAAERARAAVILGRAEIAEAAAEHLEA